MKSYPAHVGIFHKLICVNWTRTERRKEQEKGWWWFRLLLGICYLSFKVILHQFWVKKISPWKFNLEYGDTLSLLSYSCMFQVEICSQQLEICKSVCMFIVLAIVLWRLINFRLFCSNDCWSWPREEKINNHGCWGKHAHIPDNDYWGICLFHVVWTICFGAIILMVVHTEYNFIFFIIWTLRMSDNLPKRVQILGHAHILCITVRENRIIWCQIFCDLLLKSAF